MLTHILDICIDQLVFTLQDRNLSVHQARDLIIKYNLLIFVFPTLCISSGRLYQNAQNQRKINVLLF